MQTYINKVLNGDILTCDKVKKAVDRHINDLERAKNGSFSYVFDEKKANHPIDFIEKFCKHSKGKWAGTNIILEPWQRFIIGSIFGWVHKQTLLRRFKTGYVQVARKSGKSTKLAGTGLYMLTGDGEAGAEVYSAATMRDQAKIVHEEAKRMVQKSPFLKKHLKVFRDTIIFEKMFGKFIPLGADADSLDGLNVHCAIIDELHAHKKRDMWDVMETATGSREQPLILAITTAGFNVDGICYEQYAYISKVLDGVLEDDSYFGYIAELDKEDDWTDPKNWIKANPNLGVSNDIDDLMRKCKKAQEMPSAQNNFLTKHMNIWVNQVEKWVNLQIWKENNKPLPDLHGMDCYGGMDLSSVSDLTSTCLEFPLPNGEFGVISHYFIPEERALERERADKVPYSVWEKQGFVTFTPGETVDYEFVKHWFREMQKKFNIVQIGFDPYNAVQLSVEMEKEGFVMVQVRQGYLTLSPATKGIEKVYLDRKLVHGNNPVLTWCANNMVVKTDPSGNVKPDKQMANQKIDGMVALICAHSRAMHQETTKSIYEDPERRWADY
jgi:phage terminase large subunit-like protein